MPKYIEKNIFILYIYAWNKQIVGSVRRSPTQVLIRVTRVQHAEK